MQEKKMQEIKYRLENKKEISKNTEKEEGDNPCENKQKIDKSFNVKMLNIQVSGSTCRLL